MIVIIVIIFFKLPYLTKLNERQIQDAKFSRPQKETLRF